MDRFLDIFDPPSPTLEGTFNKRFSTYIWKTIWQPWLQMIHMYYRFKKPENLESKLKIRIRNPGKNFWHFFFLYIYEHCLLKALLFCTSDFLWIYRQGWNCIAVLHFVRNFYLVRWVRLITEISKPTFGVRWYTFGKKYHRRGI